MKQTEVEEEIEAARTPAGGWLKKDLERWGVPWPPPKGWKKALIKTAHRRKSKTAAIGAISHGAAIGTPSQSDAAAGAHQISTGLGQRTGGGTKTPNLQIDVQRANLKWQREEQNLSQPVFVWAHAWRPAGASLRFQPRIEIRKFSCATGGNRKFPNVLRADRWPELRE